MDDLIRLIKMKVDYQPFSNCFTFTKTFAEQIVH